MKSVKAFLKLLTSAKYHWSNIEYIMHIGIFLVLGILVARVDHVGAFAVWWNREEARMGTCNGKEFDIAKERCCGNELYPVKTGSESCCGWKLLDSTTEQCCHDFVIEIHEQCNYDYPLKKYRPTTPQAEDV